MLTPIVQILLLFSVAFIDKSNGFDSTDPEWSSNDPFRQKNDTAGAHWFGSRMPGPSMPGGHSQYPGQSFPFTGGWPPRPPTSFPPRDPGFYCSAHASYLLSYTARDIGPLGTSPFVNPNNRHYPREIMGRQYCRYTATQNDAVCYSCCNTAARGYSIPAGKVRSLLVAFNPYNLKQLARLDTPSDRSQFRNKRQSDYGDDNENSGRFRRNNAAPGTSTPDVAMVQCMCCVPMFGDYRQF